MDLPKRKTIRLGGFDYNLPGMYFVTICTKDRKCILSDIVIDDQNNVVNELTEYGLLVDKYINKMNDFYSNINVENYVIMPNHIHLLIKIIDMDDICMGGPSGRSVPTIKPTSRNNSVISKFVATLKRFSNKDCGENIWQYRSNDHVIRNETDYRNIWEYIDSNPGKWFEDRYNISNL